MSLFIIYLNHTGALLFPKTEKNPTEEMVETLLESRIPKGKWVKPLSGFFSRFMNGSAGQPEPCNKMDKARHIQSDSLKQLRHLAADEAPVDGTSETMEQEPAAPVTVSCEEMEMPAG